MSVTKIGLAAVCLSLATAVSAGAEGAVYLGIGKAEKGDITKSDAVPFAVGYINQNADKVIWGLDIAREGTMLDSTWGQDSAVTAAISYNFIYGTNVTKTPDSRLDVGLLIGARESFSSCADSYLGYQCYADTAPDTKYKVNYGVIVTYSYKQALFGLRATGESVQAVMGVKF